MAKRVRSSTYMMDARFRQYFGNVRVDESKTVHQDKTASFRRIAEMGT